MYIHIHISAPICSIYFSLIQHSIWCKHCAHNKDEWKWCQEKQHRATAKARSMHCQQKNSCLPPLWHHVISKPSSSPSSTEMGDSGFCFLFQGHERQETSMNSKALPFNHYFTGENRANTMHLEIQSRHNMLLFCNNKWNMETKQQQEQHHDRS